MSGAQAHTVTVGDYEIRALRQGAHTWVYEVWCGDRRITASGAHHHRSPHGALQFGRRWLAAWQCRAGARSGR